MLNFQRYWKVIFQTTILILVGLLSFPSIVVAENLNQLEALIKQREWNEVSKIASPGGDATLYHQTYRIRSFLNSRDNCIKHPINLTCYEETMKKWKDLVEDPTSKNVRWSKEFVSYLNVQKDDFITNINQIKEDRNKRQEEERIEREKAKEEARIERQKSEQDRIKRQEEEQIEQEKIEEKNRIKKEKSKQERNKRQEEERIKTKKEIEEKKREEEKAFTIVSNKAAKLGYKKVLKVGIPTFLYQVKHGKINLEDGLNVLLWSKPESLAARANSHFKLLQILESTLIYNLSDYAKGELVEFTIIVPKERGKSYLEGQVLRGEYFTYTGDITYQTVLGANKTVPAFKIVDIDHD